MLLRSYFWVLFVIWKQLLKNWKGWQGLILGLVDYNYNTIVCRMHAEVCTFYDGIVYKQINLMGLVFRIVNTVLL